ncbi:glycoside hydrolase family 2 protein [Aureibaculum conchae]|uniref:glycoside hydrolase family 2 protein n=1 Tax=Aureibaculum sp. 2308TA14-22 TaxID=3108392 RepID=UPI00339554B2
MKKLISIIFTLLFLQLIHGGSLAYGVISLEKKNRDKSKLTDNNQIVLDTKLNSEFISLDGNWYFKVDRYNKGLRENWFKEKFDISTWEDILVPGNWDLKNEYADYSGKAWYKKSIKIPIDLKGKVLRLKFESVYNDAKIWFNGQLIGENDMGFLPFEFDITKFVQYGVINQITVLVDNTFKRGALWNWGGIRRPVCVEITDKVYLDYQHITATPNIEKGTAKVNVKFAIVNKDYVDRSINYNVGLYYKEKLVVPKNSEGSLEIEAGTTKLHAVTFQISKKNVHLWHFNYPHLYTSKVQIYNPDAKLKKHGLQDRFGIRQIEVNGLELKLNGEIIRPVGFNLVPEDRTTGNTLPLWRIKEDIDLMKSLGSNMARLSHLPLPKSFLDYMDEKGIMTFEEVPLWQIDPMVDPDHPTPKQWLKRMVHEKFNHPSVIGWCVGNEIGSKRRNLKVREYVKLAIEEAKKLDSTRLALYVSDTAPTEENDPAEFCDVIMVNSYSNWGKRADMTNQRYPNKPIFISELGKELNSENLNKGIINADVLLKELRHKPYVIGTSFWTFNDYRSSWQASPTWSTPPSQNRTWGVVDVFRRPKLAFFNLRKEYLPFKIKELDHSTKPLMSGQKITTSLILDPRDVNDFPVYDMKGYSLIWYVLDNEGRVADGKLIRLPDMKPGSKEFQKKIQWQIPRYGGQYIKIALLDPQYYTVYDTITYLKKPSKPNILKIHGGSNGVRIIFKKSDLATSWKARYGLKELTKETDLTINDYIEIPELKFGESYNIQLIAVNNFGETSSEIRQVTIGRDVFPPIIRSTIPADGSFFIGYSVDRTDFLYDVRYGIRPGEYDYSFSLGNVGVCQIPDLSNGQTYYYQFRRRAQWGFPSQWSHEIAVTPNEESELSFPKVIGVIRQPKRAIIIINPVAKATGYNIKVMEKKGGQEFELTYTTSLIESLIVENLNPKKQYDFFIKTIGEQGASDYKIIEDHSFKMKL